MAHGKYEHTIGSAADDRDSNGMKNSTNGYLWHITSLRI